MLQYTSNQFLIKIVITTTIKCFLKKCLYRFANNDFKKKYLQLHNNERFRKISMKKEEFYGAKKSINIWDNVDNIVISKSIKTQKRSKYLIGYLDDVIKPIVLTHTMGEYITTL